MESFKTGEAVGNGAAINVELGWIPDRVEVYDATDGTSVTICFPNRLVIPFSGGGTNVLAAGDKITGVTNTGATAIIAAVLLYSGSWAGGDAAGFFIVERDDWSGTNFGSENVIGEASGATDDATVTIQVEHGYDIDTEVAAVTTAATMARAYVGSSGSNAKGFTIGATLAEEAKLLRWSAWRNDR